MRRKILPTLFVIVFLAVADLRAQFSEDYRNSNVDSLENVLLANLLSGTERLHIHWDLSWYYLYADDYEKIMYHSRKGIALAETMDSLYIAADLYNNLGVAYDYVSMADSAMLYFEKALEIVGQMEQVEKPERIAKIKGVIYFTIANLYSVQRKTNEALTYYFMALKLFEDYRITNEIANTLGNIGITYYDVENYEQAEIYLLRKEKICRENHYDINLAHTLASLSGVYQYNKDFDKALAAVEEALSLFEKYGAKPGYLLSCHANLSAIYLDGYGDDVKAMEYAELALKEAEELNIPLNICNSLMQQAYVFLFRKDYAAAEKSALKAMQTDSTHLLLNQLLYECIAKANIGLGNIEKASEYFDRFKESQTAYANSNFQGQLSEMEVKYETEKKEIRIAALEEEKRLVMWLGIAGGGVLLLGLITLFLLWRWAAQKKRLAEQQIIQLQQEKQLIATQAVLDGEVQERTRLARDLHDGLGSILAATKYSLVDIKKVSEQEQVNMERFDNAINMLDESIRELRRVAHHLMPDSLSNFGLKQSIADFCNSIPHVTFAYYGDETRFDPKMEVMIYRIMHELVSNALKHSTASHILVEIVRADDSISLTVQDDGCGFNSEEAFKGMGLSNIRTRVAAYNGNLLIDSKVRVGTEVNVELKIGN